jgi:ribosomal protein S18 acetylase RimI-like enzyme
MTIFSIREAAPEDAVPLTDLLNSIISIGGTTAHLSHFDAERMQREFIKPTLNISCLVAESKGQIAGFQSLEWSDPEWTGADLLPSDWAFIASFVAPDKHGKGIGKRLFEHTKKRAISSRVNTIDATIRADNEAGLLYYSSLGFTDYDRIIASPLADGRLVDRIRTKIRLFPK